MRKLAGECNGTNKNRDSSVSRIYFAKRGPKSHANSQNTALKGAQIHRRLQKKRGADYEKEYAVKRVVEVAGTELTVEGRADGVVIGDELFIEEIKTSDPTYDELSENTKTLYWSQAKSLRCHP